MKPYPLRGFAVLALLAIAPCARALTITQTLNFTGGGASSNGGQIMFGFDRDWHITPFDPELGTLSSVIINMTATGTITGLEQNPFTTPMTYQPSFRITAQVYEKPIGEGTPMQSATGVGATPPPTIIAPGGSARVTGSATALLEWEITSGLNWFSGSDPVLMLRTLSFRNAGWGATIMTATVDAAVTYTYSVPEHGSTLVLFLVPMICGHFVHRRMRIDRSRPTL